MHRSVACRTSVSVLVTLTLVAFGAWVAPAGAQSGGTQGVTAKEIKIGAVIGKTNPNGVKYDQVVTGAQAYFDEVNRDGGVFGKRFKIVKVLDDQTRASKDILAARSMTEEVKPFAVIKAGQEFAGADTYVKAGMPVFGYNIQTQWSKGPNLFGAYGSYICFDCPSLYASFLANKVGAKRVAIFAYGSSPQSAACAESIRKALDRWGPKVAVFDTSISFGFSANDISGAVQAMKDNQVDYVATCMDLNGVVNIKKALVAAGGQGVTFQAPQGYDAETLDELGDDLEDFYFSLQFVPFESAAGNPGMTRFLKAMKQRKLQPNENLLVGWVSAALLTKGIEDAGKQFTQQSVIDAINKTTSWTADGMMSPVNWTSAHGPAQPGDIDCFSYVAVEKGKFVPQFGQPGKPLVCFPVNPYPATLDSPTFQGGTG